MHEPDKHGMSHVTATLQPSELYQELVKRGIPIDSHQSDLYFPVTEETRSLVENYAFRGLVTTFYSKGERWYDVPFAYLPFWENSQDL